MVLLYVTINFIIVCHGVTDGFCFIRLFSTCLCSSTISSSTICGSTKSLCSICTSTILKYYSLCVVYVQILVSKFHLERPLEIDVIGKSLETTMLDVS